jgi:Zn-dependent protease with chaperone function
VTYENPEVPHEVNVSRENALAEFVRLVVGIGLVAVVAAAALYFAGGYLARLVPFSTEQAWVGDQVLGFDVAGTAGPEYDEVERYLQGLADSLAAGMELPEGMAVKVHYAELGVPNAFATLGGHIVITSALYARMPSENALATVVAHEIGHVKARDPISAVGGGASLALVLALVSGEAETLVPQLATLVALGYSRTAESRADAEAIRALRAHYGHAGGAASVFEILAEVGGEARAAVPTFLSTHPADAERVATLRAAAGEWNAALQPLRPIAVAAP